MTFLTLRPDSFTLLTCTLFETEDTKSESHGHKYEYEFRHKYWYELFRLFPPYLTNIGLYVLPSSFRFWYELMGVGRGAARPPDAGQSDAVPVDLMSGPHRSYQPHRVH